MNYPELIITFLLTYLIIAKILPYFIFPNFYRKSRVEKYKHIRRLAKRLKSKNKDKTLKNVYAYITRNYQGNSRQFEWKNILTIFKTGDFSTKKILNRKQFLWCFNQNKLMKSILLNTDQFKENEIIIEHRFNHIFIHQWISIKSKNKKYIIDPFYKIFKVNSRNKKNQDNI